MHAFHAPVTGDNMEAMWRLAKALFPVYRSLCGPGFAASLDLVSGELPLTVLEYPSGGQAFDWTAPKEFSVRRAYVVGPDGERRFDFHDCSYHLWLYSQPFTGVVDKQELLRHLVTQPDAPDAVPLRTSYYRKDWGFCASADQARDLPEGDYQVVIDVTHADGALRMGEVFLPGESEQEIVFATYLCHPRGANDNLSGVVVATELFKLLSAFPRRRFSYRLVIWPETIGGITYIANHPERLARTAGGFVLYCLGDPGPFTFKPSYHGGSLMDRAARHALKHSGLPYRTTPYSHAWGGDERQFNAIGPRLPFCCIMRSPPGQFPTYHTSADDLDYVRPERLRESLEVYVRLVETLERARFYRGNFFVDPHLTAHGVFPFHHGGGTGSVGNQTAKSYYHLMGGVDGRTDLLEIAERAKLPVSCFDEAVTDFLRTGLMDETPPPGGG